MPERPRVLVAGVSTRALAESAARAGFCVTAIDAFGDLDLEAVAQVIPLRRDRAQRSTAHAATDAVRWRSTDAVVYVSNLENYPGALRLLCQGRVLWGNPPEVLARVRNPVLLTRALRRRGFAVPAVRTTPPAARSGAAWLLKPRRSGGGSGVTVWRAGDRVPRSKVLQQRMTGTPGSIVFAADGRRATPLGMSRQLVGLRAFGATGFRYCGSILGSTETPTFARYDAVLHTATALACAVAEEFGVVGLNGVDFIVRNGVPYLIEVNPRYSASMELVEWATGVSIFDLHVRACRGALPRGMLLRRPRPTAYGKAVVYARRPVTLGDTRRWLRDPSVRDVPHPGAQIGRGHPICTVFAEGRDARRCQRALVRRAAEIYREAERRRERAA